MAREDRIECERARLQLMTAVRSDSSSEWVDNLNDVFKTYTNLVTNIEYEEKKQEEEWTDLYEQIRHVLPEFTVNEDGGITIKGIA